MTTFLQLVDETLGMFASFTGQVEQQCALKGNIAADSLTMVLADPSMAGKGLYEIDEELVFATQGDALSGTLTIAPFGRGQQGTTPVAHSDGARISRAPRLPRSRVKAALNEVLSGLYPDLFAVKVDESNFIGLSPYNWGYPLPNDVEDVLDV